MAEEQKVLHSKCCLTLVYPLTWRQHTGDSCEILSTSLFPQCFSQRESSFSAADSQAAAKPHGFSLCLIVC